MTAAGALLASLLAPLAHRELPDSTNLHMMVYPSFTLGSEGVGVALEAMVAQNGRMAGLILERSTPFEGMTGIETHPDQSTVRTGLRLGLARVRPWTALWAHAQGTVSFRTLRGAIAESGTNRMGGGWDSYRWQETVTPGIGFGAGLLTHLRIIGLGLEADWTREENRNLSTFRLVSSIGWFE